MKKAETKQRLLESTLHLMSEKGYVGATTREISRHAGVTELTLFRHFGTKEKLFVELLSSYAFLPRLKEIMPELGSYTYEEALTLIAMKFLTTLKERKSMMKILFSEIHVYPQKVKKIYRSYVDEVRATLAGYFFLMQEKGVLRNVSPEIAARTFLGMLVNYFRTEEIMKDNGMTKKRMEQAVKDMVDIFINGTQKFNYTSGGESR